MAFADWSDSYSVRVQALDAQHKKLFDIVNRLYEAMKAGSGKQAMADTLNQLVQYTQQHFSQEEALLQRAGYAELPTQKIQHARFVAQIKGFSDDVKSGASAVSIELLEFLRNWLTQHILKEDQAYSAALNASGVR